MTESNGNRLTATTKAVIAIAVLGATAVSVIGLLSSYKTLSTTAATNWGWQWPWALPVGIDLAIPSFTLIGLLLIQFDIPVGWVPIFPRALTIATVYLNWSADRTTPGRLGHAALVMLWVVFSEIAGRVYAHQAALRDETRIERVRRIRWVLAPMSTASLWRRMQLWEITSYRQALAMERNRKLVRAGLRERFGRFWRFRTSRTELVQLRLGELVPADLAAAGSEVPVNPTDVVPVVPEPPVNQVPNQAVEPVNSQVPARSEPAAEPEPKADEPVRPNLTRSQPKRSKAKPATAGKPSAASGGATPSVTEQVRQILDLIEEHGIDTVKLKFVMDETGMPKTTAYNRLIEARTAWSEANEQGDS